MIKKQVRRAKYETGKKNTCWFHDNGIDPDLNGHGCLCRWRSKKSEAEFCSGIEQGSSRCGRYLYCDSPFVRDDGQQLLWRNCL